MIIASIAPPTRISLKKAGCQHIQMSIVPHVPACTGREMDAVSFDEYGFLISREDQDGMESRSHDYR